AAHRGGAAASRRGGRGAGADRCRGAVRGLALRRRPPCHHEARHLRRHSRRAGPGLSTGLSRRRRAAAHPTRGHLRDRRLAADPVAARAGGVHLARDADAVPASLGRRRAVGRLHRHLGHRAGASRARSARLGRPRTRRRVSRRLRRQSPPVSGDALRLALFNALLLIAGSGVTGALGWWRGRSLVRVLGLSYLAGVAAFGVLAQLLYACGASLSTWKVVAVCALLALGGLGATRGRPLQPATRTRWRLAGVIVAGMLALLAVDLWFQPLWAYDAWTFWTPKAHGLWALGLDSRWFTQANLTSPDYPILLPAVEAAGFHFTGYEQSLLDLQSLLFFAAFLRAVYELAHEHGDAAVLWAVLAMLAVAPSVADQLAAAEADIPLAVLFATAGL